MFLPLVWCGYALLDDSCTSIVASSIRARHNVSWLWSRPQSPDKGLSLCMVAQSQLGCLQVASQLCNGVILCISLHLTQAVKNLLGVGCSIGSDVASILAHLITNRIYVPIRLAAIVLSYKLFILYIL